MIKVKASTYWGVVCFEDKDGKRYKAVESIDIKLSCGDVVIEGKIKPPGKKSSMGHGCGDGYYQAAIESRILGMNVYINDWVNCITELEEL